MSQEYDNYLRDHISNVNKALEWLLNHDFVFHSIYGLAHDESKYNEEEYDAYDDYFYGKEGKDEDDISVIDSAFDYAWLHHIHHNPHHWQHWVLFEDEGKVKALEMPVDCVYEMIADWWSFSWKTGNLYEIFTWYDAHKEKMELHPKTKAMVENILSEMKSILDAEGNHAT